jgi:hypothetical protein
MSMNHLMTYPKCQNIIWVKVNLRSTVLTNCQLLIEYSQTRYNDIGLYNTSPIQSDFLWYELICHC